MCQEIFQSESLQTANETDQQLVSGISGALFGFYVTQIVFAALGLIWFIYKYFEYSDRMEGQNGRKWIT